MFPIGIFIATHEIPKKYSRWILLIIVLIIFSTFFFRNNVIVGFRIDNSKNITNEKIFIGKSNADLSKEISALILKKVYRNGDSGFTGANIHASLFFFSIFLIALLWDFGNFYLEKNRKYVCLLFYILSFSLLIFLFLFSGFMEQYFMGLFFSQTLKDFPQIIGYDDPYAAIKFYGSAYFAMGFYKEISKIIRSSKD